MGKPRKSPDRTNAERVVKVICMIVNEAIKVILALRGVR